MRVPLVAAVLAAALAAACGTGDNKPATVAMAGQRVPRDSLLTVAEGLCDAARQAGTDPGAARETFLGRSHTGIHVIAKALQDVDRPAAASLLEAKQKVEADLERPERSARTADDLRALAAITRASLARFKVKVPACPPPS